MMGIDFILDVIEQIKIQISNPAIMSSVLISVLAMDMIISIYEFVVYKFVSHRSLYNKSFNVSISVIPFFISTIILCLQSNIAVTLGTIGALAIIRYRTAVKDPIDMVYILWSVHTGIVCGCQLFSVAIITSLVVTITLLVLENAKWGGTTHMFLFCGASQMSLKSIQSSLRAKQNGTELEVETIIIRDLTLLLIYQLIIIISFVRS